MSDKEAIQGLVRKVKQVIPRLPTPEEEAPPELVEKIGAEFERQLRLQGIGASAVAEVEEQERQERQ